MTTPTTTAGAVVELVGNPRAGSRTRSLADHVAQVLSARLDGGVADERTVIELGEAVAVGFGADPVRAAAPLADPFGAVRRSTLLVVATPTYKGTYSGLLKLFLDQLDQGDLAHTVAVPVAVAGAPAHRESVAAALRALLLELGARVPAPAVALLESELAEQARHVERWAAEHVAAVRASLLQAPARTAPSS